MSAKILKHPSIRKPCREVLEELIKCSDKMKAITVSYLNEKGVVMCAWGWNEVNNGELYCLVHKGRDILHERLLEDEGEE